MAYRSLRPDMTTLQPGLLPFRTPKEGDFAIIFCKSFEFQLDICVVRL